MNNTFPLLSVGEQASTLHREAGVAHHLAIGWQNVLPGPIRRSPPSPYDLETAIQTIEDAIMPALMQRESASGSLAIQLPEHLADLPLQANQDGSYPIDTLENAFRRLCEIAEGSPVSNDAALIHPETVAVLLILREVMHHGGFMLCKIKS